MSSSVEAIDLANYAKMAERMFPASQGIAIADCAGKLVIGSNDQIQNLMSDLQEHCPLWHEPGQDAQRIDAGPDVSVLVMNLQSGDDPAAGFLLWWVAASPATHKSADLYDTLLSLGSCIKTELQLQTELDHMAVELSERYEELNLVYHTDDQVSYFSEGVEALQTLIQNCSDYLNSSLAVLYLREKGVVVVSKSKLDATDTRLIRSMLDAGLYDDVVKNQEVEFLNNGDTSSLDMGTLPYRLMVGPVVGFGDRADGVMLIANLPSERPFSNSDKNLLSVMSRKTAKIIQSSYDGLTGLFNRTSFENLVKSELENIQSSGATHCILHLNIDKLHRVNDTLGHDAGDMVLQRVAETVHKELRDTDYVARVGGDEFGVFVDSCDVSIGTRIAGKLGVAISSLKLEWQGEKIAITASVGIAELTQASPSGDQAITNAAVACDFAGEKGGNAVHAYQHDDTGLKERELNMWMVSTVHTALRENHFVLYAQPIVPLKATGRAHLEILLRMRDGDKIIAPHAFLPASERYQLMTAIDKWVVENSLAAVSEYLDQQPRHVPIFSINLSGQSFCSAEFCSFVVEQLKNSGVPTNLICFEITETAAVSNMAGAQAFIKKLRKLGCTFALDDFGAGLSSFGYLKSFDVQYLKIDGALVRDIATDKVDAAMVESVNQIGHVMELETIAEFVETPEAKAILTKMGVDYAQGFLLGKPSPLADQLAAWNSESALSAS